MAVPVQLSDYIKKEREKGLDDAVIRQILLQRGWKERMVDEGLVGQVGIKEPLESEVMQMETHETKVILPVAPEVPSMTMPEMPKAVETPALSVPSVPAAPAVSAVKIVKPRRWGKWLVVLTVLVIAIALGWVGFNSFKGSGFQLSSLLGKFSQFSGVGGPGPTPTPTREQHQQDIQKKASEMLDHVSKKEYVEALSYFDIKGQPNLTYDDILTALAVMKVNFHAANDELQYDIPLENIEIDGETAVVTVNLTTEDGSVKQAFLDYHYSYWHIINVRLSGEFEELKLTRTPDVIQELYGTINFSGFLPNYNLEGEDQIQVTQIELDETQKAIVFKTATPTSKSYLIAVYEPYFAHQYIPVTAGETLNYTLPLTTDSYGVIYVFDNFENKIVNQESIPYLINSDPRLRVVFKAL